MKLIDRFVSRELVVNVLFAIAVAELGPRGRKYFPQTGKTAAKDTPTLAIEDIIGKFSQGKHIVD
jgi:hypothetical protein